MREVQMKRAPAGRSSYRPPDFARQRPNIQQQLHIDGAEGLPQHRQAEGSRRRHDAGVPR